jgi:hypothetical protein
MINLNVKKHYLINSFTGFVNVYNTKVISVESKNNTLVIEMNVNPASLDFELLSDRIFTVVTYNLINGTFSIKPEGKGSRKHNYKVKYEVTGIIDHLVSLANKAYKVDTSEATLLTEKYYCNRLTDAGGGVQQSNELLHNINHTYNSIQEIQTVFNNMMNDLQPIIINNQTKENENMLTTNEKEVIATRLSIDPTALNKSAFTNEELKNENIVGLINKHADKLTVIALLEKENIILPNSVFEWNNTQRNSYKFYFNNVMSNILDGTFSDNVNAIRNEYKEYKSKIDYKIKIEKSFELPDHEVTLGIFIERDGRDGRYEGIVKAEHENIIKSAIENGLHVPADVMKDYSHLVKIDTNENETTYSVGNKHFNEYSQAVTYCNESDFDPEQMIIKEVATMQPSQDTQLPELFQLYKNTFTTYSDAYNYALKYRIPVTMIISNKHEYMTNERLQELEKEYVFGKG